MPHAQPGELQPVRHRPVVVSQRARSVNGPRQPEHSGLVAEATEMMTNLTAEEQEKVREQETQDPQKEVEKRED